MAHPSKKDKKERQVSLKRNKATITSPATASVVSKCGPSRRRSSAIPKKEGPKSVRMQLGRFTQPVEVYAGRSSTPCPGQEIMVKSKFGILHFLQQQPRFTLGVICWLVISKFEDMRQRFLLSIIPYCTKKLIFAPAIVRRASMFALVISPAHHPLPSHLRILRRPTSACIPRRTGAQSNGVDYYAQTSLGGNVSNSWKQLFWVLLFPTLEGPWQLSQGYIC